MFSPTEFQCESFYSCFSQWTKVIQRIIVFSDHVKVNEVSLKNNTSFRDRNRYGYKKTYEKALRLIKELVC